RADRPGAPAATRSPWPSWTVRPHWRSAPGTGCSPRRSGSMQRVAGTSGPARSSWPAARSGPGARTSWRRWAPSRWHRGDDRRRADGGPGSERPGSEQGRRSGGYRLGERLDLGHPGSHRIVEAAGQFERYDVVGRMDEHGRGTPLAQPAGHGAEPGLPSRDGAVRVVPADVADDGMGRQGPGPAGHPRLVPPGFPFGVAGRRAAEQDGGVEGHPFGTGLTQRPLELVFRSRVREERAVPYLDAVPVPRRETAQETDQGAEVGG